MKLNYREFDAYALSLSIDPLAKAKIMAVAVAFVLAHHASLPSTPVDDVDCYYSQFVETVVGPELADVNEAVIFDMGSALELTKMFWQLRYNALHGKRFTFFKDDDRFFDIAYGMNRYVSKENYAFLETHKRVIFKLVDQFEMMLEYAERDTHGTETL